MSYGGAVAIIVLSALLAAVRFVLWVYGVD